MSQDYMRPWQVHSIARSLQPDLTRAGEGIGVGLAAHIGPPVACRGLGLGWVARRDRSAARSMDEIDEALNREIGGEARERRRGHRGNDVLDRHSGPCRDWSDHAQPRQCR